MMPGEQDEVVAARLSMEREARLRSLADSWHSEAQALIFSDGSTYTSIAMLRCAKALEDLLDGR